MNLNDVHRGITRHKKRKRIGRGPGSGHGKTAGSRSQGTRFARRRFAEGYLPGRRHAPGPPRAEARVQQSLGR